MNFGSDERVRNAFRATLLDEPSSAGVLGTQEIDAADVLEVTDLAHAIAKAEEVIRARSSRALGGGPDSSAEPFDRAGDIFDKLVATDDAVGPAVHAPYRPTPLPPRTSPIPLPPGVLRPATLLRAPEAVTATPIPVAVTPTPVTAPVAPVSAAPALTPAPLPSSPGATQPLAALAIPPAPRTAPILILDEDAFYHPAGRIRSFADATLDGYRPEPTLMVRIRERRHTLSLGVGLVLVPLALLAIFAVAVGFGRASAAHDGEVVTAKAPTVAVTAAAAPKPTAAVASPATTATMSTTTATPVETRATPASEVPVFDVNSLKSAPPAGKTRR
ncbi:MAG: hypothetical protein KF795_20105 [Labilithrix sp.]|nr:hypothetical protein [Labilithrix sp.]